MAKVYDAIKRVEEERSRQAWATRKATEEPRAQAQAPESTAAPSPRPRWSERLGLATNSARTEADSAERYKAILDRLDAHERSARERLPEIERHMLQVLELRLQSLEREQQANLSAVSDRLDRYATRALAGLVIVLAGVVAVLLRQ